MNIWPFSALKRHKEALLSVENSLYRSRGTARKFESELTAAEAKIKHLEEQAEIERIKLVAIGVGAMCNTRASAAMQRIAPGDLYYCATLQDVYNLVDREMDIRERCGTFEEALRKLSCLGNGERPGNSTGNMIAIRALEAHASTKVCIKCGTEMVPLHSEDKKICSNGACGHEVEWTLAEGQQYQYKRNVEPFVEDRSAVREPLPEVGAE
ncbi:MAG: hypothetical protein RR740_00550 [Pseudomonas sp.]